MQNLPYLSVIIPVHNEERRLSWCLEQMIPFLAQQYGAFEIVVVENGSTDATRDVLRVYTNTYHQVRAIYLNARGKGLAVKHGMLYSTGFYRYMCDVDLSTPLEEIPNFLRLAHEFDVVIGSREMLPEQVHTTQLRRILGRAWHSFLGELSCGFKDTQCGFKLFRDWAAMEIFERVQTDGMAFDVEVLYLARMGGWRIIEMPVQWTHNPDSRVRFTDGLRAGIDVISLPWRHMYDEKKLPT